MCSMYIFNDNYDDNSFFSDSRYPVYTDPIVQGNLRWDDSRYPGVDILLTSDWPKGISNRTQASEVRDLGMDQELIFS